MQTEV